MRIVILGAGGHAQVIADAMRRARETDAPWELVGFLDDNPSLAGQWRLDAPILGNLSALSTIPHDGCVIGIGDNRTRQRIFQQLTAMGERLVTIIHPRATIATNIEIGDGTVVFAGAVVNVGATIGHNVILNTGCTVDHHNIVGNHVHVAPGVHLGGDVRVGEGAMIGIGAVVMPQRTVGAWSVAGAASLVHDNVPERQTVMGVPAKPSKPHSHAQAIS